MAFSMNQSTESNVELPHVLSWVWRRFRVPLIFAMTLGLLIGQGWNSGPMSVVMRATIIACVATIIFSIFERWPRHLPKWFARWVLQVTTVAVSVPLAVLGIYFFNTAPGAPSFWHDKDRLEGFTTLCVAGVLFAPWVALGALIKQKEAIVRDQALAFELERSELEREALDARLHLLQAQVAPHFLFNTLANIQALVDTGSPQASKVLRSLIAYLRAAVPRLNETGTTIGREVQMVQAYLELMHMRMPDRLQFSIDAEASTHHLRCPPLTLLTLVENAIRHGIDPSEEGGRIDIRIHQENARCLVSVRDTGLGLETGSSGLGTGLATLRERLKLYFGAAALLRVSGGQPNGVCAEIEFPIHEMENQECVPLH